MSDAAALLDAYDAQCVRTSTSRYRSGIVSDRDGPLVRTTGFGDQGWVEYRDLGGLEGDGLDELIARQVRVLHANAASSSNGSCTATTCRPTSRSGCSPPASSPRTRRRSDRPRLGSRLRAEPAGRRVDPRGDRACRPEADRDDGGGGVGRGPQLAGRSRNRARGGSRGTPDLRRRGRRHRRQRRLGAFPVAARSSRRSGAARPSRNGAAAASTARSSPSGHASQPNAAALHRDRRLRRQPPDPERLGFIPVTTTTPYVWSPPSG